MRQNASVTAITNDDVDGCGDDDECASLCFIDIFFLILFVVRRILNIECKITNGRLIDYGRRDNLTATKEIKWYFLLLLESLFRNER